MTQTSEGGKKKAVDAVEALCPIASTNIWDGLKSSPDLIKYAAPFPQSDIAQTSESTKSLVSPAHHRVSSVFLLTDGQSNCNPSRGHIPMLKSYFKSNPEVKHTTVHAVANVYATWSESLDLCVNIIKGNGKPLTPKEASGVQVVGGYNAIPTLTGLEVTCDPLLFGQTRDLIIRLPRSLAPSKTSINVTARAVPWDSADPVAVSATLIATHASNAETANFILHKARLDFCSEVFKVFSIDANPADDPGRGTVKPPGDAETEVQKLIISIERRISTAFL